MKKYSSLIFLAVGMILFGSATPVSKIIGLEISVFTASSLRVILGSLVLLPFVIKELHLVKNIQLNNWLLIFGIAIFGMVGFTASLIKGMSYISGVSGSVIMATVPMVTAIAARVFLKSPFTKLKIIAVLLAVAGTISMQLFKESSGSSNDHYLLGSLLVFGAVICEAAYTLLGKKATEDNPPLLVTFLAMTMAIPIFLLLCLTEKESFKKLFSIDYKTLFALLWWGTGTLALGSLCWYKGVQKSQASTVPAFMGLMPLSALMISYWLLDEQFHPSHLVGFGLVFCGVLLMSRAHMKMTKETKHSGQ
jgi:drug/metabolite transporter (DMT)-like permease